MRTNWKTRILALGGAAALAATGHQASAVQIGFDDYDTATAGSGFATRAFSPDNNSNTGFDDNGSAPDGTPLLSPTFGGSPFDLYGIARRDNAGAGGAFNGEPFDVFDDSAGTFPPDVMGYDPTNGGVDPSTNGFVVVADTSGGNGGPVTTTYTFDISGYQNLSVSMDWAAFGDFETSDGTIVSASIDAGPSQTLMNVGLTSAQDAADTLYTSTMASGTVADIYFSPFFDQTLYDNWAAAGFVAGSYQNSSGVSQNVDWHPGDTDFDGRIDEPTALDAANTTEAYRNVTTGFNDQEQEAYKDPLIEQISGTQLNNVMQTITANVSGTGSTLTLTILSAGAGSLEYQLWDNISVDGDAAVLEILGDYDNSLLVGQGDLSLVLQNWGDTEANATALAAWVNDSQVNDDGTIGQFELSQVLQNWGDTSLTLEEAVSLVYDQTGLDYSHLLTSVPEPGSLALMGVGGLMLLRRRKA